MKNNDEIFLLILVDRVTPRLKWILHLLENEMPGYTFSCTNDSIRFQNAADSKISYSRRALSSDIFKLPVHSLLFESEIKEQPLYTDYAYNLPVLFAATEKNTDFAFDIFAAIFYLLSRYEEYLPSEKDIHGRFQAKNSVAVRFNFLHLPVVQLWVREFAESLRKFYPHLPAPAYKKYRFLPTYDIDIAWSYREKGLYRNLGGWLQDIKKGRIKAVTERIFVLLGTKKDPFDVYDFLENLHKKYRFSPVYFFLLGQRGIYDKNIRFDNTRLVNLIQKIHQKHPVGIHPSYASNEDESLQETEIKRLQNILGEKTQRSRQHYLKLNLPFTYRSLLRHGIKDDYTMGYAARPGFRAGTARSYLWFDLEKNRPTDLRIHPFQVMDVTLSRYLCLPPKEALETVKNLIEITKSVGGTFSTLWHNSSFPDEEAYRLYEDVVCAAATEQHSQTPPASEKQQ